MDSLATTNIWLGILAVVSLIEFLMILAAGFLAYRMYSRMMTTIETLERVHLAPLRVRVDGLLDEVQAITDKVKRAQELVGEALKHMAGAGTIVAGAVKSKAWPILGIIQGLRSAAATVMKNGSKDPAPFPQTGA